MSTKLAAVIRHVAFEDLGSFAEILSKNGFHIQYFEAGIDDLSELAHIQPKLLIILGGPIGAYEQDKYPFLQTEMDILSQRIAYDQPTLGICLGAQLIASALGARVYSGGKKEIGWASLQLTAVAECGYFQYLSSQRTPVLHWHGDTFDLPPEAILLASSAVYPHQAFSYKNNILALQFHPEIIANRIEAWLIGHAAELAANPEISLGRLRSNTRKYGETLQTCAKLFLQGWLDGLKS
jgi:GMP synthase (glutamine-hydrolysing)